MRCMHGVPPLTWDTEVAVAAQRWANDAGGRMHHGGFDYYRGGRIGQNAYMGSGSMNAHGVVALWYDEIQLTNGGITDHFAYNTAHYTQVVWAGTQKLGCGRAPSSQIPGGTLVFCDYFPAGNMGGAFLQNVHRPTRSEAQCGR